MIVLIILIATFAASAGIYKFVSGDCQYILSGNIAMFLMLCFTAAGHFKFSAGMQQMIPKFVPLRKELVFITGILEILAGIALLFPALRQTTGLLLILFFILILPANVFAAIHHIDYQKGTFDGQGPGYLWFRIPMQLLLIFWIWFFAVKN